MRPPRPTFLFMTGFLVVLSVGCAKEQTLADQQVGKLQNTVVDVQKDQDKEFDSFSKEIGADAVRPTGPARTSALGANGGRPVIRIGEDGSQAEGDGDIDDPSPRPVIRGVGSAPSTSRGRNGMRLSEPQREPSSSSDDPDRPRPSALDPEARKAYDSALSLAQSKRCSEALDAFAGFLVRWPDHPYAPNAMYWRGECFSAQGDNAAALREFEGVVTRFSLSTKAPDALLKAGMVYDKLGERDKAQAAYARIAKEYPRSEAARRVPNAPAPATKAGGPGPVKGPKENP